MKLAGRYVKLASKVVEVDLTISEQHTATAKSAHFIKSNLKLV